MAWNQAEREYYLSACDCAGSNSGYFVGCIRLEKTSESVR